MPALRIAFVAPYLNTLSGWRSLTVGAIASLQARGHHPYVVVSEDDAPDAELLWPDLEIMVVPRTHYLAFQGIRSGATALRTWLRLATGKLPPLDLVHSLEAYPTGLIGHWMARRLRVPHVITAVGTYAVHVGVSRLDRALYARVLLQAAQVCPISSGTRDLLLEHWGAHLDTDKIRVVLIGSEYARKVSAAATGLRRDEAAPLVLSVGAIKPRKGYHVSLLAFAGLQRRLPSARYRIVGAVHDREYHEELQALIARLELSGVEFSGAVSSEELDRCYREASVFLLTPQQVDLNFEGFGLVYLEAGAYGLPVVGTRTGGVPDAVRSEETGLLVDPEDAEAAGDALHRLIEDRDLWRRLGAGNRAWAEQLTWERFAAEQEEVYGRVLRGRGSPASVSSPLGSASHVTS